MIDVVVDRAAIRLPAEELTGAAHVIDAANSKKAIVSPIRHTKVNKFVRKMPDFMIEQRQIEPSLSLMQ